MVKAILCTLLILFSQNNIEENNTERLIREYVELSVELDKDTVCLGNELELTVIFKNKTDSCISFYPRAILSIIKASNSFSFEACFLDKILDLRKPYELAPQETYKLFFKVQVTLPVFREGINYLHVHYICKKQKGKHSKYNKLYGSLESEEFTVFVE